jgi:hypothetical protein
MTVGAIDIWGGKFSTMSQAADYRSSTETAMSRSGPWPSEACYV